MDLHGYDPVTLPPAVLAYLDARDDNDFARALATFSADAVVHDDGATYRGLEEINSWIEASSTTFTYTTTRIAQYVRGGLAVVRVRLEGDFPGGVVELNNRFEGAKHQISELTITA